MATHFMYVLSLGRDPGPRDPAWGQSVTWPLEGGPGWRYQDKEWLLPGWVFAKSGWAVHGSSLGPAKAGVVLWQINSSLLTGEQICTSSL